MTDIKPKFIDRLATAFFAASLVFLPGLILLNNPDQTFTGFAHPLSWLDQVATGVAFYLAIIFASMFVFAWPTEKFLIDPNYSTLRAAAVYVQVFLVFGLIMLAPTFLIPNSWGLITFVLAAPIAALTAFISRLLYPKLIKFKWIGRIGSTILVAIMIFPLALPDYREMSYQVTDFYPDELPGEISRGTWDVNEEDGAAGSQHLDSGLLPNPKLNYQIVWNCENPNGSKYTISVRSENTDYYSQEYEVVCDSSESKIEPYGFEVTGEELTVRIWPVEDYSPDRPEFSDAYAILAPAN